MAGRPRKPAAIREAEGNRSKREIPQEPEYAVGIPDRPPLSVPGRKVWDELVAQMVGTGVLRKSDGRALAALCENEALTSEAYASVWGALKYIQKNAKENKQQLPGGAFALWVGTRDGKAAFNALRDLSRMTSIERQQFGLTPSSRSKVPIEVSAAMDEWEAAQCADTAVQTRRVQ
jgi:phage terminase small subunit